MHARLALRNPILCTLSLLASLLALPVLAQDYTFTRIADSSGQFKTFHINPVINEMGTVAFCAELDAGGDSIYISDGSTLSLISGTSGGGVSFFPVINNNNSVAYVVEHTIMLWNGGTATPLYTIPSSSSSSISLNDNDYVACWQESGIVRGNGGALTTIANTSGPLSYLYKFGTLNNNGVASISARRDAGGYGIYYSAGGTMFPVAESGGNIGSFGAVTAINDYGDVAYQVRFTDGEEALYIYHNGVSTLVADTHSSYASFADFALNSDGNIVFSAVLDNGIGGIFTGPDPALDCVIMEGDTLDGHTVDLTPWVDRAGFNNRGQIVFHVIFTDNTRGIYRADPVNMTTVRYDANRDGRPDMLLNNPNSGQVAFWCMKGVQVMGGELVNTTLSANWQVRSTGDFNGDGKAEIVLQNTVTGQVMLWYMEGSTVAANHILASKLPANWLVSGVGDINEDGNNDIILCNPSTGQVAFWMMNGETVKEGRFASATLPANWQVAGVGRFDDDAHLDLVLTNTATGQVAFWYLNGPRVLNGGLASATLPANWIIVGVGDADLDGHNDLTLQNTANGTVAYWYMRGRQVLSGRLISATLPAGWRASGPR